MEDKTSKTVYRTNKDKFFVSHDIFEKSEILEDIGWNFFWLDFKTSDIINKTKEFSLYRSDLPKPKKNKKHYLGFTSHAKPFFNIKIHLEGNLNPPKPVKLWRPETFPNDIIKGEHNSKHIGKSRSLKVKLSIFQKNGIVHDIKGEVILSYLRSRTIIKKEPLVLKHEIDLSFVPKFIHLPITFIQE